MDENRVFRHAGPGSLRKKRSANVILPRPVSALAVIYASMVYVFTDGLGGSVPVFTHQGAIADAAPPGLIILRWLQFLLRKIDCNIMCSGNECSGNRQADHEQDEAGEW